MQDLRDAVINTLVEEQNRGADLSVMVADSTSTSKIAPFEKAFPDRVINVGIAEQNMVGMAAGVALVAARYLPPTRHLSCLPALTSS